MIILYRPTISEGKTNKMYVALRGEVTIGPAAAGREVLGTSAMLGDAANNDLFPDEEKVHDLVIGNRCQHSLLVMIFMH